MSKHKNPDPRKEQEGDVLGISHANPSFHIPSSGKGGHPEGIEVRGHASGIGDLTQGKGATGVDMGGGGSGTDIEPAASHARTRTAQENKEE